MLKILQKNDPILRKVAKEAPLKELDTPKFKHLLDEMQKTLEACDDGVALAAPQVGESFRIFVVSPRAFLIEEEEGELEGHKNKKKEISNLIYINPEITKRSSKKVTLDEGCLSVRHVFGKIKRHEKVTITAYDEKGAKFTRGASGLLAEIFQHETDHLNGVLFIDSATDLIEVAHNKDGGTK